MRERPALFLVVSKIRSFRYKKSANANTFLHCKSRESKDADYYFLGSSLSVDLSGFGTAIIPSKILSKSVNGSG